MKKLLLILILFFAFTVTGNCDWLGSEGDWDYRIELEIDYTNKISGPVTWFPADVFLTASQAEEVFAELTNDIEYKKIQFTEADGTSLLYGHMKVFNVSETKGLFTVSADGWTIDANTSIFLYYDKDHIDNNTYIGAINTSACEAVYNPQFVGVWDMEDGADNSHIYDATSNSVDGTKKDPNQPNQVEGKIGQAQEFDGDDDLIDCPKDISDLSDYTIEALVKLSSDAAVTYPGIISMRTGDEADYADGVTFQFRDDGGYYLDAQGAAITDHLPKVDANSIGVDLSFGVWYYVSITVDRDGGVGGVIQYINGSQTTTGTAIDNPTHRDDIILGARFYSSATIGFFFGDTDEVRVSDTIRTAAWAKGTYNSWWDDLFTYGSQEEPPGAANIMLMFPAF